MPIALKISGTNSAYFHSPVQLTRYAMMMGSNPALRLPQKEVQPASSAVRRPPMSWMVDQIMPCTRPTPNSEQHRVTITQRTSAIQGTSASERPPMPRPTTAAGNLASLREPVRRMMASATNPYSVTLKYSVNQGMAVYQADVLSDRPCSFIR